MNAPAAGVPTLYDRIGGEATLARLVDAFYDRVLDDEDLAPFFEHTPMERLRRMQLEFFGAALDGPQSYSGLALAHAHQGRGIRVHHFQKYVQHLLDTLEGFDLSKEDREEIITRISKYVNNITSAGTTTG
jgi:hemoglobin